MAAETLAILVLGGLAVWLIFRRKPAPPLVEITAVLWPDGRHESQLVPADAVGANKARLAVCYLAKLAWAIKSEPPQIQAGLKEIVGQAVDFWPTSAGESLLDRIPAADAMLSSIDGAPAAVPGGERFSIRFFVRKDGSGYVTNDLPNPGLSANLAWHYVLVLDVIQQSLDAYHRDRLRGSLFKLLDCLRKANNEEEGLSGLVKLVRQANEAWSDSDSDGDKLAPTSMVSDPVLARIAKARDLIESLSLDFSSALIQPEVVHRILLKYVEFKGLDLPDFSKDLQAISGAWEDPDQRNQLIELCTPNHKLSKLGGMDSVFLRLRSEIYNTFYAIVVFHLANSDASSFHRDVSVGLMALRKRETSAAAISTLTPSLPMNDCEGISRAAQDHFKRVYDQCANENVVSAVMQVSKDLCAEVFQPCTLSVVVETLYRRVRKGLIEIADSTA